jgi:HEAT repeat protein
VVAKFNADLYHEDTERQRLAVTALGWIGESEVVDPLLRAINHPDPGIRRLAINSLARIGEVANHEPIVMALNDENNSVRKAAVSTLIALKGAEAIQDIRMLLDDPDVWVKYHTINAIGELGDESLAQYIIPHLTSDHDIIKIAAVKALSQMRSAEVLPVLQQLRGDKNKDLAEAARLALTTIGSTY